MADAQLPGGGDWTLFWFGIAATIGAALHHFIEFLARLAGWRKQVDRNHDKDLHLKIVTVVKTEVDHHISPMRQHLAEIQRGLEGKQAVMDARLADFYEALRDRDAALEQSFHKRVTSDLKDQESRVTRHFDKRLDDLRQHVTEMVTMALNKRSL